MQQTATGSFKMFSIFNLKDNLKENIRKTISLKLIHFSPEHPSLWMMKLSFRDR